MQKVIEFNQTGGPEVLKIVDREIPVPAENEVVVQVKYAGLNRAEYMYFHGQYIVQPEFPSKVGLEATGIIHSVGSGVSQFSVGDEVCLTPNVNANEYGFIGEFVTAPSSAIVKKPISVSFKQGAAVWMAYATAFGTLVIKGGLQQGKNQTILITAASSSVGVAAIQIAKNFGAKVIATTRTSTKKDFIYSAGADYVIATEEENLPEKVKAYTEGKGFDIAIDAIAGEFVNMLAEAAAPEASIVIYGILSMSDTPLPLFPLMIKGIKVSGFHLVFHLLDQSHRFNEMKTNVLEGLQSGKYNPITDEKEFTLDTIVEAYNYLGSNKQKGKIVVKVS